MADISQLVFRCKKQDPLAQRALYENYKARLMGVCRRYASCREEAQDILQDVFIKIFTKINQLDSSERLEGWMIRIAINIAVNYYHRSKRNLFDDVAKNDADNGEHEVILSKIDDAYLIELINALPDGCRLVFNLFVVEGYSHAEVAEILKISESTSRSQLVYAKKLLKDKLNSVGVMHYERYA
jgi:RNA polymerase sigma-70 factor (ECF subfamily)